MLAKVDVLAVRTPQDLAAVQQLCRSFVAWQLDEFPHLREKILIYFEPVAWEQTLAELPEIHGRPKGDIFLARAEGLPVGCIMYRQLEVGGPLEEGVGEVKRLFVSSSARRNGAASCLMAALLNQAKADEYHELRLETAKFFSGAIGFYRRHGFTDFSPTIDLPDGIKDITVFMRKEL